MSISPQSPREGTLAAVAHCGVPGIDLRVQTWTSPARTAIPPFTKRRRAGTLTDTSQSECGPVLGVTARLPCTHQTGWE